MAQKIFGYNWTDIQRAQQGGSLSRPVASRPKPTATEEDKRLLAEHGLAGLEERGCFGVIDRLKTSGLL